MWTALVVTCPAHTWVAPLERELARMLALGPPDHRADTVRLYNYIYIYVSRISTLQVLVVPDPGAGVGSGGATLNALLVATEHLSARSH